MPLSRNRQSPSAGFTLIELLIVITVIAIFSVMAIPGLSRSRIAANEGSALSSINAILTANQVYETRFNAYATQLSDLSDLGMIDDLLGTADALPGKSGYILSYTSTSSQFSLNVDPIQAGQTGERFFFVDHSGVIRFRDGGSAASTDQPID